MDRHRSSTTISLFARGFSLIELIVVLTVVGLLMALLLPALQEVRSAARLLQCKNNLKQIGLAMHNYHSVYDCFPLGGRSHPGRAFTQPFVSNSLSGVSWYVGLLPYLDQSPLYNKLNTTSAASGDVTLGPNGPIADRFLLPTAICPSSPVPPVFTFLNFTVMTPSYVGISGATPSPSSGFTEPRIATFPPCSGSSMGPMSWGGMLLANQITTLKNASDGGSNVLLVGESANFVRDASGIPQRMDGGQNRGWLYSTPCAGTMSRYHSNNTALRCFNLTTVADPVGLRTTPVPAGCLNQSPNRPLNSGHAQGAQALLVDGSVRFLSAGMDLTTLKRMSTRDDGASTTE